MTKYEMLMSECDELIIEERPMKSSGLYGDGCIWINKNMTTAEKCSVLAEELGHHYTTVGDILDQSDIGNRKQERKARAWAYEKIVPLDSIKQAFTTGHREPWGIAEYLDVDEQFLRDAMQYYEEVYGDELMREFQKIDLQEGLKWVGIEVDD